ncbi:hypoxanthine phosphoribosyltransferase [Chloroflexota bacterium]
MNYQTKPHILFRHEEITAAVQILAEEIRRDYQDKNPLLLGILKGSFMFMADLVRVLNVPVEIEFIRLSSYRNVGTAPGNLEMVQGLRTEIRGRNILIIEDIIDSGKTIAYLQNYLKKKGAASLKLCALMDKPARREAEITIDYLGFTVPDKFLIGYGLDWDEKFRYLADIYTLEIED